MWGEEEEERGGVVVVGGWACVNTKDSSSPMTLPIKMMN